MTPEQLPRALVQGDLFKADIAWFPVLCEMLRSGAAADLQPHTMMVYLTLKSYADFNTGIAQTTIETVAKETGMSVRQAATSVGRLVGKGLIRRLRKGGRDRSSAYQIVERLTIKDHGNNTVAIADWEFIRRDWQGHLREIRQAVLDELQRTAGSAGGLSDRHLVLIENLQVNLQLIQNQFVHPTNGTPATSPARDSAHSQNYPQRGVRFYPQGGK
ncbi:MAG: hypothetical protein JWR07_4032 [Nevskia sp.]|nr:hypothetical protein [Nevskia sp.]